MCSPDNGRMKGSRRGTRDTVWIVLDESEDAPELVLGVFDSSEDAQQFFRSLAHGDQHESVALGEYHVGSTFRDGSKRYQS
jgi:hypothetical protein